MIAYKVKFNKIYCKMISNKGLLRHKAANITVKTIPAVISIKVLIRTDFPLA